MKSYTIILQMVVVDDASSPHEHPEDLLDQNITEREALYKETCDQV